MAEREVIYRIKTIIDPGNKAAYDEIFKQGQAYEREKARSEEAMAKKHEEAQERARRATQKTYAEERKAAQDASEQAMRARDKEIKERQRKEQEYSRWWEGELKKREKEEQRALDETRRNHERALAQIKAGNTQLREGIFGTVEGLGRLARGFTLMGFVADKDLQKLIEQLAVVQGGIDLILGGIKVYDGLRKGVEGYRLAVQAAATAEATLAATRAGGAAAGGASAVAAGGLAGGGLAAAAPIAAAVAAFAGIVLAGRAVIDTFNGISRYGVGGGVAPASQSAWVGDQQNSFRTWSFRKMEGILPGLQNKYKQAWGNDELIGQIEGEDKANRMAARLRIQQEQRANREAQEDYQRSLANVSKEEGQTIRGRQREGFWNTYGSKSFSSSTRPGLEGAFGRDQQLFTLREQLGSRPGATENEKLENERRVRQQIFELEKRSRAERLRDALDPLTGRMAHLNKRLGAGFTGEPAEQETERLRVLSEIRNVEKQISQEKERSAAQAMEASRQELTSIQQILRTREESMRSAAERFANLTPAEQTQLRKIAGKAREGGAESLSRRERMMLKGVGTEESSDIARRSAEAELSRRGIDFAAEFGGADSRRSDALRREADRLAADIKVHADASITVILDEERTSRMFEGEFEKMERRLVELAEQAARKVPGERRSELDRNNAKRGLLGGP